MAKMSTHHEDVEFRTLDGLTIRGWLYPAASRGPAIVITPGVSSILGDFESTAEPASSRILSRYQRPIFILRFGRRIPPKRRVRSRGSSIA